ncbi:hypothetical protein OAE80_04070 [Planctomycetaceae bacterium]|nr:hypothetical protein [Planctomycetaceae bacterium]
MAGALRETEAPSELSEMHFTEDYLYFTAETHMLTHASAWHPTLQNHDQSEPARRGQR